jgi:hypothetical protein
VTVTTCAYSQCRPRSLAQVHGWPCVVIRGRGKGRGARMRYDTVVHLSTMDSTSTDGSLAIVLADLRACVHRWACPYCHRRQNRIRRGLVSNFSWLLFFVPIVDSGNFFCISTSSVRA